MKRKEGKFQKQQLKEGLALYNHNARSLTSTELLSHLMRDYDLAGEIIDKIDSLKDLRDMVVQDLQSLGISKAKSETIICGIELGRRLYIETTEMEKLDAAEKIARYIRPKFTSIDGAEELIAVYLNASLMLIKHEIIGRGGLSGLTIHARDILAPALKCNAKHLILCHNHPGRSHNPSDEDIIFTTCLVESCDIIGVNMVDHIVITEDSYYSMSQNMEGEIGFA